MACFCRFEAEGAARYGLLRGQEVEELSAAPWKQGTPTGSLQALSGAPLLAPTQPSKIVCVGRNYRDHAAELGNPLPPSRSSS